MALVFAIVEGSFNLDERKGMCSLPYLTVVIRLFFFRFVLYLGRNGLMLSAGGSSRVRLPIMSSREITS